MRLFLFILCLALLIPVHLLFAMDVENTETTTEEVAAPAETGETTNTTNKTEEEDLKKWDEQEKETFFDDEEEAEKPAPTTKEDVEDGEKIFRGKVTIDAVVIVNYTFLNAGENYNVKYHINMGGEINSNVGMIRGNAKVATDIGGFLAKTSAFECLLKVSIADVPYEIMFKKLNDSEADINVSFKGQILEDWESLCTFLDTSGAKFNTRGSPERWIGVALEKAKPSLTKLTTPLDPAKTTTLKFTISKHAVPDEGLGSAEIDGTGVVTIAPSGKAKKEETEEEEF